MAKVWGAFRFIIILKNAKSRQLQPNNSSHFSNRIFDRVCSLVSGYMSLVNEMKQ